MSIRTVALPIRTGAETSLAWPTKAPGDGLPHALDCAKYMAAEGDAISDFIASSSVPDELVVAKLGVVGNAMLVRLSGGTAGRQYGVKFTAALASGDTLVRTVWLSVNEVSGPPGYSGGVVIPAGPPGDAGPAGPSGSGTVPMPAGANLSGHRALMPDSAGGVVHADPSAPGYQFAGISTGAATTGMPVQVAAAGATITEPSWSWTPGARLFVASNGTLTATVPLAGLVHQVAIALTGTTVLVQPLSPIRLT